MPLPSTEFDRIISASQLEQLVIVQLQTWFATYAREIERQQNLAFDSIRTPLTWTTRNRYQSLPGEELPKCVVVSPGLAAPPQRFDRGRYRAIWRLGVAIAESYADEAFADTLSKSMAAIVRAILVQKPNLGGLGSKIEWVDETYGDIGVANGSKVMNAKVCSTFFTVDVEGVTSKFRGPTTPNLPPQGYNYGKVQTVTVDLEPMGVTSGGGGGGGTGGIEVAIVGHTLADLGTPEDGSFGVIRIGSWPNLHEILLVFNATASAWIGEEQTVMTTSDTLALDLGDRSATDLVQYGPIKNPVPYGRKYTQLNGNQDVASAVLTVLSTNTFDAAGEILIRDNIITYTGKTPTTFTGCTLSAGSGGVIPSTVDVVQGFNGGYGPVPSSVEHVAELYAAGFHLQEQMTALMNGEPGNAHRLLIAPYWLEMNPGDGVIDLGIPLSGGVGLGAVLTGTISDNGPKTGERPFTWAGNNWSTFSAGTPTKTYLIPKLVGSMEAGSIDTGECLDVTLRVRWIGNV